MKILFLMRYESYKKSKKTFNIVKEKITKSGHTFLTNIKYASIAATKPEDYVMHIEKLKKEADIIIADINEESTGVGHDIEWGLMNRKPCLIFYNKQNEDQVSIILARKKDKLLTKLTYENENSLENGIEKFLKEATQKVDTKFILIISPEIDKYLEWASDYKRMHKAQIVRNAIEKEMEQDDDYEKYQKEREI